MLKNALDATFNVDGQSVNKKTLIWPMLVKDHLMSYIYSGEIPYCFASANLYLRFQMYNTRYDDINVIMRRQLKN